MILVFLLFYLEENKNSKNFKHNLLNDYIADISNLSLKINDFIADINNSWINPDKIRRMIIITNKKMLLFDEMKQK